MSATPAPPKRSRKPVAIALVVIIVGAILMIPPIVYGGFTVPVSRVTFSETTGSLNVTNAQVNVETKTAYEYMFSTRFGGMVQTSDTDVSASRGTANITISLELTNPANQTVQLGNVNISGAMGTRNHTLILSAEQGVRAPGTYELKIVITANIAPLGGLLELNVSKTITLSFTVS